MEDKDYIKDLFKDKLEHLETDVRADLWSSISSNIPSSTTKILTKTIIKKVVIGFSTAAAVGGFTYVLLTKEKTSESYSKPEAIEEKRIPKDENVSLSNNTLKIPSQLASKEDNVSGLELLLKDEKADSSSFEKADNPDIKVSNFTDIILPPLESEILPQLIGEQLSAINQSVSTLFKQEDTQIVDVTLNEDIPEEKETTYFIDELPNIFTPNSDQTNDYLTVNSEGINEFYLIVLNASNQVVYSTSDSNFSWDGTGLNGDKVPVGDYVYYITGKDKTGATVYKSSLLRITY
jgi:gliding motility-associated-like protein